MKQELWKDIPGFEGEYKASNTGKIRKVEKYSEVEGQEGKKVKKGRIIKPTTGPYGYNRVKFYIDGKQICNTVHKLVALTWIGEMPAHKTQIDHIDGNSQNNDFENLRYVTNSENQIYAARARAKNGYVDPKLNRKRNREVIITKDDKVLEFESTVAASNYIGCNKDGVLKVCRGYNKTIYGWECNYLESDSDNNE